MMAAPVTELERRIVRVVVRMGGVSADAAEAAGCTKGRATYIARKLLGWRFREGGRS